MTISLTSALSIRGELSASGEGGVAKLQINEGLSKTVANGTILDAATHIYMDDFSSTAAIPTTSRLRGRSVI